jgi:hypothetical protein
MEFTTKEFCEMVGIEYQMGVGVISFLEHKGVVKRVGERKRPDGKGKGSILYSPEPNTVQLIKAAFEPIAK